MMVQRDMRRWMKARVYFHMDPETVHGNDAAPRARDVGRIGFCLRPRRSFSQVCESPSALWSKRFADPFRKSQLDCGRI